MLGVRSLVLAFVLFSFHVTADIPVWGQAGGSDGQFNGLPSGVAVGLKLSTPQVSSVVSNPRNSSYYDSLVLTDARGNYIFSADGKISVANYSADTITQNTTPDELQATFVNGNGLVFLGSQLGAGVAVNSSIFDPISQTFTPLYGNVMLLGRNDNFYIFVPSENKICYNTANLTTIWCAPAFNSNWALLSPSDGSLLVGDSNGIFKFSESDGTRTTWTTENAAPANIRFPAAVNSNDQILTLTKSKRYIVLFDSDGELWRKNVTLNQDQNGNSQFLIYSLPDNSFVVFTSTIFRITTERKILWDIPWIGGVSLTENPGPQIIDSGSSLLVVRDEPSTNSSVRLLSKLDLGNGEIIWDYTLEGEISAAMALDNSSVVAFSTFNQSNVYTISGVNGICASKTDKEDCLDLTNCGWCSESLTCEDAYCDPNQSCCSASWSGSQCFSSNVVTATKGGDECDPEFHRRLIIGLCIIVSVVAAIIIIASFVIYCIIERRKKQKGSYQAIE